MNLYSREKLEAIVPLSDFHWNGTDFQLSPSVSIKRLKELPDFGIFADYLSKWDYDTLNDATHWLFIKRDETEEIKLAELMSLALLALWIAAPSRTQAKYRFEVVDGQVKIPVRVHDYFQWVRGQAATFIKTEKLQAAAELFPALKEVWLARKRLWYSLTFTYAGCTSFWWQVKFICFASAFEEILTYSEKSGVTRRLAKSFACLTQTDLDKRKESSLKFRKLYKTRSDILHGRVFNVEKEKRIPALCEFSNSLRILWNSVLTTDAKDELEKDDAGREAYFRKLGGD